MILHVSWEGLGKGKEEAGGDKGKKRREGGASEQRTHETAMIKSNAIWHANIKTLI